MQVYEVTKPWLDPVDGSGGGSAEPVASSDGVAAPDPAANPAMTIDPALLGPDINVAAQQPDPTQAAIQQMAAQMQNLQREILALRTGKPTTAPTAQPNQSFDDLDPNAPVLRQLQELRGQMQTELQSQRKLLEDAQQAQATMTLREVASSELAGLDNVIKATAENIPMVKGVPAMLADVTSEVREFFAPHIKANPTNHGITAQMVQMETQKRVARIQGYIKSLATVNNNAIAQQVTANNATATASGGATPAPGAGPKPKLSLNSDKSWEYVETKMREAEQRLRQAAGVK